MATRMAKSGVGLVVAAVISTFAVSYAAAASYWSAGFGLVGQNVFNSCYWARANLRIPSNNPAQDLDFNTYVYKEPFTSCNAAAPWTAATTSDMGLAATLHKTNGTFCAETGWRLAPSGAATPYGWGRAYKRAGACATGQLVSRAYAATTGSADFNTIRAQVFTP